MTRRQALLAIAKRILHRLRHFNALNTPSNNGGPFYVFGLGGNGLLEATFHEKAQKNRRKWRPLKDDDHCFQQ